MRRHFTVTGFVSHGGRTALHWHRLGSWLPPGGHVEPDEDPVQAMLREVREETGLEVELLGADPRFDYAKPPQLPPPVTIGVYDIPDGDRTLAEPHQHIDFIYFTRALDDNPALPEEMQWRWFSADQLRAATDLKDDVRELGLAAIEAERDAVAGR